MCGTHLFFVLLAVDYPNKYLYKMISCVMFSIIIFKIQLKSALLIVNRLISQQSQLVVATSGRCKEEDVLGVF